MNIVKKALVMGVFGEGASPTFDAIITPTYGAEVLTNPGLEAPYSSGLANGWAKNSTPTTTEETTIIHAGASSQKIVATLNTQGVYQFKNASLTANQWVRIYGYGYGIEGAFAIHAMLNDDGRVKTTVANGQWQRVIRTGRFVSGNTGLWAQQNGATASSGYFDDCSVKVISIPSCFGTKIFQTSAGDVFIEMGLSLVTHTQMGAWLNVDDPANPQNGVAVYVDGERLFLYKIVAGVWTLVFSETSYAWTNGDILSILKVGTSYKIYRNYVLKTSQTISDAGVIGNVNHRQFSTLDENTFSLFQTADMAASVTKKITTLGDSITAGLLPTAWTNYFVGKYNNANVTSQNRALSGAAIVFNGISGILTQATAAASDDADIIFIALGTNDLTNNDTIRTTYEAGVAALQSSNPDAAIYGLGIFPRTDMTNVVSKNAYIQTACANSGITYIDTTGWIDPATDTTDGLHPTVAGATKIAQRLLAVVPA